MSKYRIYPDPETTGASEPWVVEADTFEPAVSYDGTTMARVGSLWIPYPLLLRVEVEEPDCSMVSVSRDDLEAALLVKADKDACARLIDALNASRKPATRVVWERGS